MTPLEVLAHAALEELQPRAKVLRQGGWDASLRVVAPEPYVREVQLVLRLELARMPLEAAPEAYP